MQSVKYHAPRLAPPPAARHGAPTSTRLLRPANLFMGAPLHRMGYMTSLMPLKHHGSRYYVCGRLGVDGVINNITHQLITAPPHHHPGTPP